jgi:hypothetical protein
VELPSLDELRSQADARIRCKCGKFLGNSNCSTSGRLGDAERGLCPCDTCLCRMEVLPC